jgi:hypothetical protein
VSSMTTTPCKSGSEPFVYEGGRAGALIGQRGAGLRLLPLTATSQLVTSILYIQESGQTQFSGKNIA